MDNTFTFTVVLTREELRANGPSVVGMSFYNLGAAVFEWGGERNKDENGIPAARIHGHHAAHRVAHHAVAEWMGWGNPLEMDLALANVRIYDFISEINAHRQAWALVRRAVDLGMDGMTLTPEARAFMEHVLASYTPNDAEPVIDRMAELEAENKRLAEALAECIKRKEEEVERLTDKIASLLAASLNQTET